MAPQGHHALRGPRPSKTGSECCGLDVLEGPQSRRLRGACADACLPFVVGNRSAMVAFVAIRAVNRLEVREASPGG